MPSKHVLQRIKRDLDIHLGKRIRLRANKGRKRIVVREGLLEGTYPHVFVVRLDEAPFNGRKVSYSYTDILTSTVELSICGENGEEPLPFQAAASE